MLEIKNLVTEMKKAFDGLISKILSSNMTEERIKEPEDRSRKTSKTEKQS